MGKRKLEVEDGASNQKAGIVGKYGCRYGRTNREQKRSSLISKAKVYQCALCRKTSVKRLSCGLWHCKGCNVDFAGGAYTYQTRTYVAIRATTKRLRENKTEMTAARAAK